MPASSAFVDGVLGSLPPLGPIRARAMFGGWGPLLDDAETEPRFAAAGAAAFTYPRQGQQVALSYREAPSAARSAARSAAPWGAGALLPWAELSLEAARRARGKRRNQARGR